MVMAVMMMAVAGTCLLSDTAGRTLVFHLVVASRFTGASRLEPPWWKVTTRWRNAGLLSNDSPRRRNTSKICTNHLVGERNRTPPPVRVLMKSALNGIKVRERTHAHVRTLVRARACQRQ